MTPSSTVGARAGGAPSRAMSRLLCACLLAAVAALCGAASAPAATVWLCKPGLPHDPCTPGLRTTRVAATGAPLGTFTPSVLKRRPVDCFYVYPTVSDQPTPVATRRIDPEERSGALYQAARYSSLCRVYAPMYRQVTLAALFGGAPVTAAQRNLGYRDVRAAWRYYLCHDNHGRGVILIGHSQGTFVLRRLLRSEIDPRPAIRRRLVSALLLGGNVLRCEFRHVPACRSRAQLGCAIAFSTFNATPPAAALFGRPSGGREVVCTNPAALGGGTGKLDTVLPSAPFAPSTSFGKVAPGVGYPAVQARTPWVEADGLFAVHCLREDGANVLQVTREEVLHA